MTTPSPDKRTTDGLLACPHCGGDAMPWSGDWDDNNPDYTKREYFVNCGTCHAQTDRHASEAQAVAAWNRRTPAHSLTASLERVKELEKENSELHFAVAGAGAVMSQQREQMDMAAFARIRELEAEVDRLNTWSKTVWCQSCQNTGYIDSDGTCGNCELGREKARRRQVESRMKTYSDALDSWQRRLDPLFDILEKANATKPDDTCVIEEAVAHIVSLTQSQTLARAEVKALAFEEAAKVADKVADDYDKLWTRAKTFSDERSYAAANATAVEIAALIRSLKSKGGSQGE